MCKIWVLLLAILSAYIHMATSTEDPHLCIKNVEVPYTVTERVNLDNYGEFAIVVSLPWLKKSNWSHAKYAAMATSLLLYPERAANLCLHQLKTPNSAPQQHQ
ncbi:uncharacterized protein LOC26528237 [Drosophila mojavensis]|uniref:Uncharacterized protein n=1 Tax=Drosophila mojavensis TaxID=7230 RepID=A0A0Q9X4G8_DROMO|nr:uncharacterized protein LOC26528237 [Drosophila mojavensis]KRG02966.1 uncharacterized protein Dmoj_GI26596 [Drosophila mojavensis]